MATKKGNRKAAEVELALATLLLRTKMWAARYEDGPKVREEEARAQLFKALREFERLTE